MTAKKKKFIMLSVVAAILLALIIRIAWGNTALEHIYNQQFSSAGEL